MAMIMTFYSFFWLMKKARLISPKAFIIRAMAKNDDADKTQKLSLMTALADDFPILEKLLTSEAASTPAPKHPAPKTASIYAPGKSLN